MKNNQDLKRSLFIFLVLILIGDFILFMLNGFFIWQLFLKPSPLESVTPTNVDAALQATRQALELTQTQEAALTLMAIQPSETQETPTLEVTSTPEEIQPTQTETATVTPTEQQSQLDDGNYTVQANDTLQSIAAAFGISEIALRTANQMAGDTLLDGQKIQIPDTDAGSVWNYAFSALPKPAQFSQSYTPSNGSTPRFTLHVDPEQYPVNAEAPLFDFEVMALNHVETFYHESLSDTFDLYVAGTLFDQDHDLRSGTYPDANMIFIVYDGSGTKTDQLRLMTYATARFFGEKILGTAASPLLREGAATYIAQLNAEAFDNNVPPLRQYCSAYLTDDALPALTDPALRVESELVDPINFHTAGCFFQFLYEQSSIDVVKQLYTSGDYESLMGRSLDDLSLDFQAWLVHSADQQWQPVGFTAAMQDLAEQYETFMPIFDGSESHLEIYRELDMARTYFLAGSMTEGQVHLIRAKQLTAGL